MKNNIEKLQDKIELLYNEVARQKRQIEELNDLVLFSLKLIAKKDKDEDIEIL